MSDRSNPIAVNGSAPQNSASSWKQMLRDHQSRVTLGHGGGGQLTDELLASCIMPHLGNSALNELLDSAVMDNVSGKLAMTIDSYVVQPIEFPGGDIGKIAISGTVNDLAVCGAQPLGIALSLILAEGFSRDLLERVMESIGATASFAGVKVVTGDTKVVGRGESDGIYITTAGVGVIRGKRLHPDQVKPGDRILINGPIADHGMAVMLAREMPEVKSVLKSDVAPLNHLVERLLSAVPNVSFMRDPTRGGLSGLCADLAARTGFRVELNEEAIPVRPETRHAAEMLGLDVLEVANEGKVVVVVPEKDVAAALDAMRSDEFGKESCVIGQIDPSRDGLCELRTRLGGRRIIQKPYGEQLPRIC